MEMINEKDYLTSYNQNDYERPSDAVDMAVFTILNEATDNYRKLFRKELSILMIKRGEHPYKDFWALPGGFVHKGETLEEAAYRELNEEAGVSDVYLKQLHNFSNPERDPRGWIISNSFLALAEEKQFNLQAGTDATDAKWFRIRYALIETGKEMTDQGMLHRKRIKLQLFHSDITLEAVVESRALVTQRRIKNDLVLISSDGIAFDHGLIIAYAINHLRETLNESLLAFELLPEKFTLTDLQNVYEIILDEEILKANFRRKIADYVTETDDRAEGAGHRPSKLFKRNFDKLL